MEPTKNHMVWFFSFSFTTMCLGFLNANVDRFSKSPANYGLMDILAAMHWIQENIEAFGGDSKSVTLAGHGTGAACVHFLIASQAVPEGLLFHRAILMSGSGLAPWSLVGDPAHYAAIVAHHVNCSVELPHQALMVCLREVSLKSLLSTPIRMPEFGNAFGPSVDGVVIGKRKNIWWNAVSLFFCESDL